MGPWGYTLTQVPHSNPSYKARDYDRRGSRIRWRIHLQLRMDEHQALSWFSVLTWIAVALVVFILLPLAIPRATHGFSSVVLFIACYLFGTVFWMEDCCLPRDSEGWALRSSGSSSLVSAWYFAAVLSPGRIPF